MILLPYKISLISVVTLSLASVYVDSSSKTLFSLHTTCKTFVYFNTETDYIQMFITWLITINEQLHIWNEFYKPSHKTCRVLCTNYWIPNTPVLYCFLQIHSKELCNCYNQWHTFFSWNDRSWISWALLPPYCCLHQRAGIVFLPFLLDDFHL